MPPVAVHFNGGVNLPDTETVLRTLVERVPHGVRRLPDGEPGERAGWIGYQVPRLLATPGLEQVAPGTGDDPYDNSAVRLPAGTDAERIEWPDLGYAAEYARSYATFRRLREEGVVPAGVRFQVEYPTPVAVGALVHPDGRDRFVRSYGRALTADLDRLLSQIPHGDLAVQWDAAVETVLVDQQPDTLPELAGRLAALLDHVPDDVPAGLHLCYGDAGHVHMMEPESLAPQVSLVNGVMRPGPPGRRDGPAQPPGLVAPERSPRATPAWVSFTVPQYRDDEKFFAPLAELRTGPATELYLALVPYHPDRQADGTTDRQVALVDRFLPAGRAWGICTECGMARAERADVPRLLDLHREILDRHQPAR
jgi:hypothetical protein